MNPNSNKDTSRNVSGEQRAELNRKIAEIESFIQRAPQDENTKTLLEYIAGLKKDLRAKRYGLIFEEHREKIDDDLDGSVPVLTEDKERFIDNGGEINFLIEGDNLASLQLLEKTHKGKIDFIYIDPPYNTGNEDFIYGDNYVAENDTFKHSKWLSSMSRRLEVAKRLLGRKGVIFISIDDNELAQLKLLCDGIFGEENFISLYPRLRVKGGKTQTDLSTKNCDYIIAYARDIGQVAFNKISVENDPAFKYQDKYVETRGKFHTKQALDTVSLGYVASLDYPIEHNGTTYYPGQTEEKNGYRWTWSKEKYEFGLKNDFVVFKNGRIFPKKYLRASIEKDERGYYIEYIGKTKNYSQIHFIDNAYSNTNGTIDLQKLGLSFSYAKPVALVEELLKMAAKPDTTVLDFFAGSGTTGEAVMRLNKEDGGKRRFILCTNNEGPTNDEEDGICRKVTHVRLKSAIELYGYKASVKYFRVGFVPLTERVFHEYAYEILMHIRELVELENAINFTGNTRIAIILKDEELDAFAATLSEKSECEIIYLAHGVLASTEQQKLFNRLNIKVNQIPDYYFGDLVNS